MVDKHKSDQSSTQHIDWYLEAKFGLFIHWGAYSVAGVEASWPIMAPDLSEAMFKNRNDNHRSGIRHFTGQIQSDRFQS